VLSCNGNPILIKDGDANANVNDNDLPIGSIIVKAGCTFKMFFLNNYQVLKHFIFFKYGAIKYVILYKKRNFVSNAKFI
jgi:hypothetical protein